MGHVAHISKIIYMYTYTTYIYSFDNIGYHSADNNQLQPLNVQNQANQMRNYAHQTAAMRYIAYTNSFEFVYNIIYATEQHL